MLVTLGRLVRWVLAGHVYSENLPACL